MGLRLMYNSKYYQFYFHHKVSAKLRNISVLHVLVKLRPFH